MLLRSPDWIEDYEVQVGGSVHLDMPERGANGLTEILSIEPAPEIEPLAEGCDSSEYGLVTCTKGKYLRRFDRFEMTLAI